MTMATKKDILKTHLKEWLKAKGNRKKRAEITANICFVTKMHKKSVSRAFRREQLRDSAAANKSGRPVVFGPDVTAALKDVCEAANYPCGEILFPIIAEYVEIMKRDGRWKHCDSTTDKLLLAKEHTIRRRVSDMRKKYHFGKGLSSTKPSYLKSIIPIFKGPWNDLSPGNGQIDTVAHCDSSLAGDFVYSLNYIDSATYWTTTTAQWNKGQMNTIESMKTIKNRLPFPWLMAHPDSGSEFINWVAKEWFETNNIELTRSEPNKKNDNMYVEERNGHVVRKYLGYVRLDNQDLVPVINEMYILLNLYLNHFMPVRRTLTKERIGAKYHRTYEKLAMTPYQRVLNHQKVSDDIKNKLKKEHEALNPLTLKRQIDILILKIIKLKNSNQGIGDRAGDRERFG